MRLGEVRDKELLKNTVVLVNKERKTLKEILEHLAEIQRRRLYADLGYSSLFKYVVKELHYSEGAAARRVKALALISSKPIALKMIEKGERRPAKVVSRMRSLLRTKGVRTQYLSVVDPETLIAVKRVRPPVLLAVAARVGKTRLIDNLLVRK